MTSKKISEDRKIFWNDDINECRAWLRVAGLEIKSLKGWTNGKDRVGLIDYAGTGGQGTWMAVHYLTSNV